MSTLFVAKLVVAVAVVIGLSLVAERVSPRVAGILSGAPTGSAITLFFIGAEAGPDFASQSAVYNMLGLVAMQVFVYFYYKASLRLNIFFSSIVAIAGYFVAIWGLHFIHLNRFVLMVIPTASIFLFLFLFKPIRDATVKDRVKLNAGVLFVRALAAASIILLVTGVARTVGPTWAGLFTAFPTTLFPLVLIVHLTYDREHVHTVIKNVPLGIFALVLYSLAVSLLYPTVGIYWGTLAAFGVATAYLLAYQLVRTLRLRATKG